MTTPSNEEGQPVTSPENGPDEVVDAVETEGATADAAETELTETLGEAVGGVEAVDEVDYSIGESFEGDEFAAEAPLQGDRPVQTVGRRKEAVVRVRLLPGSGGFTLNGKPLETYFPNKLHQQIVKEPLVTVEKTERFDIFANLRGGGTAGQAGALRLAIARALAELDSEDRPALKKAGWLTRDARAVERKKYGLKKARKAPQYSKR